MKYTQAPVKWSSPAHPIERLGSSTGALTLCTKAGNGHADTNGIALCLDFIIIELSAETISYVIDSLNSKYFDNRWKSFLGKIAKHSPVPASQ